MGLGNVQYLPVIREGKQNNLSAIMQVETSSAMADCLLVLSWDALAISKPSYTLGNGSVS